jgi:glycosyltransferase involved in cell wall biosynthesis
MGDLRPVVHLLPAEPFGGLQRIVIELARAQRAAGRMADIVLLGPSDRVEAYCRAAGIAPIILSGGRLGRMFALRRTLAGFGGAIFHSHCEPVWAAFVLAALGNPWVVHLHVYARYLGIRDWLTNRIYRRRPDRFVAITQSVADSFIAPGLARADRLDVVHNGLDYSALPAPTPHEAAGFTIGFVGRAVREKGLFDFIAAAELLRDDAGIDFVIAGDGEDLAEARATIAARGLGGRIQALGFVDDMAPVWSRIDLLAMLSDREPFGLVILEAIASGVGVLGYDTPSGGREIMEGITGCRLIAPSIPAIADAVRTAARSPAALREEALLGRAQILDRFSMERMEQGVALGYSRLPGTAP